MVALVPEALLERPPSRDDGVDAETEETLRSYGVELIQRAGLLLRLPQAPVGSAAAIFQRFYFRKSFAESEVRAVAAASLALATKLEETQRKLRDVILVFHRLHMRELREDDGAPIFAGKPTPALDVGGKEYTDLKNEVTRVERQILQFLGFEFTLFLDLPHKYVLRYVGALIKDGACDLAQKAWSYLNDSLRVPLMCRFQPDVLAAAAIFLAARMLGVKLPSSPPWWEALDVNLKDVKQAAVVIHELYRRPVAHHIAVPRRRREKEALDMATPFAETPGPVCGSPASDGGGDECPGPAAAPELGRATSSNSAANGRAAAPARQGSGVDHARLAEFIAAEAGGGGETLPTRQISRATSGFDKVEHSRPEEERRPAKNHKDREKDKERERERDKDRGREKDKEKDRDRGREADRTRRRDREAPEKEKQREKEKEKSGRDKTRKEKGRERRDTRGSSSGSSARNSSPRRTRRKQDAKGRDRRPKRGASKTSSSASSAKQPRRRNPSRLGVDEEDL